MLLGDIQTIHNEWSLTLCQLSLLDHLRNMWEGHCSVKEQGSGKNLGNHDVLSVELGVDGV